jgi:hypothetical protein
VPRTSFPLLPEEFSRVVEDAFSTANLFTSPYHPIEHRLERIG